MDIIPQHSVAYMKTLHFDHIVISLGLLSFIAYLTATQSILTLRTLHIQPSVNLNPHTRHTRIFRQHDKRRRTVIQKGLVFQHRALLDLLYAFFRVLQALPQVLAFERSEYSN